MKSQIIWMLQQVENLRSKSVHSIMSKERELTNFVQIFKNMKQFDPCCKNNSFLTSNDLDQALHMR